MAQRKKKPSGHQLESIARAHHKNEFLRKLKHFVNSCSGEEVFSLIPQTILDRIYIIRCHSLSVFPAKGNAIPNNLLNELRHILSAWLKKETLVLSKFNQSISIDDFLTVGLTTFYMGQIFTKEDFANAPRIKAALSNFCNDPEPYEEYNSRLTAIFTTISSCLSNIGDYFYWMNYEIDMAEDGLSGVCNRVEIHKDIHQCRQFILNGKRRPAVRLGWAHPCTGLQWTALNPKLFGVEHFLPDKPIPVYVQSHALIRLSERMDSIIPSLAQFNMFLSFQNPHISYDSYHNLLIEYQIFGIKAGYFRVDLVNGIAVVRTFLFLTQSGTPEGNLLWKNTGLQKLDTKFLALDRLSSFMTSDVGGNLQIRKIFQDSGCQSLLEFYKGGDTFSGKYPSHFTSTLILDYLGYSETPVLEEVIE